MYDIQSGYSAGTLFVHTFSVIRCLLKTKLLQIRAASPDVRTVPQ